MSESPRQSHTQFTCFTGTKVQMLTQLPELVLRRGKIQKFRAQKITQLGLKASFCSSSYSKGLIPLC
jgi:hypothetical protein